MRTVRPAEPLALYGDYPALYCLGARVPSSKTARRGVKRWVTRAIGIVGFLSLASGGLWAAKDLWSPEASIAAAVPAAVQAPAKTLGQVEKPAAGR